LSNATIGSETEREGPLVDWTGALVVGEEKEGPLVVWAGAWGVEEVEAVVDLRVLVL
jgi:hypothetical protein